jgi:hypothetical protein
MRTHVGSVLTSWIFARRDEVNRRDLAGGLESDGLGQALSQHTSITCNNHTCTRPLTCESARMLSAASTPQSCENWN